MPAPLTHRQVETFRKVMQTGSFTQAAQALRTSQPTVSRVIAELARALGFPLFRRQDGKVVPTREAVALLEAVERHYHGLEEVEDAASRIRRAEGERLRVAAITSLALSLLPPAIRRLRERFPGVPVTIESGSYETILARVTARQCDLGLALASPERPEVETRPLAAAEAVCVLARGHELARLDALGPDELAAAELILVGRQLPGRRVIDDFLAGIGIRREPLLEVQSGAIACAMAAEGLGIAVLDALSAEAFGDARVVMRPIRPRIAFRYGALTRRAADSGRLVEALIGAVAEEAAERALTSPYIAPLSAAPAGR
jgi:DNA-binding transcriptional LysR family regulator